MQSSLRTPRFFIALVSALLLAIIAFPSLVFAGSGEGSSPSEPAKVRLSGHVYDDSGSPDGQLSGDELPLAGIPVLLSDGSQTLTNENGYYEFNVAPGMYTISRGQVAGLADTGDADGGQDGKIVVKLESGQAAADLDFFVAQAASIGDFVWNDINGNGKQDERAGAGLDQVQVALYRNDGDYRYEPDDGDPLLSIAITQHGYYRFENLAPGQYWVVVNPVTLPEGLELIQGPQSAKQPLLVTVRPGEHFDQADFAYAGRGNITGTVFYDWNRDGIQGLGEEGIPNVEMCLLDDVNGNGKVDVEDDFGICQFTDEQGQFVFAGFLPGTYILQETQPEGMETTTPNLLAVTLIVSLSIASSDHNDFGEIVYGSIGNLVYLDGNGNGTQDAEETKGIGGVPITLAKVNSGEVLTVTTAADGTYLFDRLVPGTYIVEAPARHGDLTLTTPSPQQVELGIGEQRLDVKFGYVERVALRVASLAAQITSEGILVTWQTDFEIGSSGFVVWRASAPEGEYKPISEVIPSYGKSTGATYSWLDRGASGSGYWYKIQNLADDTYYGPVRAAPDPETSVTLFAPLVLR
ncbi:MAG: hypothetical protein D6775_08755 [Caldilineae bacterium]|nr:MAG: hypothetical protein D6775_08755 [Caldilineae bacterium]